MNQPSAFHTRVIRSTLAIIAVLAVFSARLPAKAGEADGIYKVTRIRTSDSFPAPKNLLSKAVSSGNRITVENNQVTIQREAWVDVLDFFNFVFTGGTAKITGPKSLTLEPTGTSTFTGKTSRPVKIALTGSFLGLETTINLRTTCKAKLNGGKLVLTFPVKISSNGETSASGTVKVTARR